MKMFGWHVTVDQPGPCPIRVCHCSDSYVLRLEDRPRYTLTPTDVEEDVILSRLLALNLERSEEQ